MLEPNKVFRPGKLPINPGNVYANRGEAESAFRRSLCRGLIPLVYGEFGVGKTSMARHVLKEVEDADKLVNIESVAGKSIRDVFARCLEKLGYYVESKCTYQKSDTSEKEGGLEFGAESTWITAKISAKKGCTHEIENTIEKELVVTSPTDSKLLELCEEKGLTLILDELHKANEEFVSDLGKFIKAYGNANCDNFHIVLLGTSSDASRLVHKDPGIDRLIEDLHLRAMENPECQKLVQEGMAGLDIHLDDDALDKLVRICVGSPNILQYLCLEASEAAFIRSPRKLTVKDVDTAVRTYVETKASRLYRSYMSAVESTGSKKFRKQILRAVAECEDEYVTMAQICNKVSEYLQTDVRSTDLSGALRKLKEEEFGAVLRDVDKPDGSGRIQNYTTFVDPALKAFIRMQILREESC